jgi:VanZ family protein
MFFYSKKSKGFFLFITVLIALIIFLVSSISSFPGIEKAGIDISLFYHFGVFFMFTFFLTLSLTNKKLDYKTILIILLVSLIYALSDEFHQLFVIGRFCDIKDVFTDFAGSIFSVIILKVLEKFKKL